MSIRPVISVISIISTKKFIVKYFRPNFPDLWKLWQAAPHMMKCIENLGGHNHE